MSKLPVIETMPNGKLVKIVKNGLCIDPLSITLMQALANAVPHRDRAGAVSAGKLIIETHKGQFTVPCDTIDHAKRLRDTLFTLCNERANELKTRPKIIPNGTDWGNKRLAGDPQYEEERARIFESFS